MVRHLCVLAAVCWLGLIAVGDSAERPNVILFYADDLGWADVGCQSNEKFVETPHVDRLAKEGMRFTQHYSGSRVCAPSRATLMSGNHTGHNLIKDNFELGGAVLVDAQYLRPSDRETRDGKPRTN